MFYNSPQYKHLSNIPIEYLNLSLKAFNVLKRMGISSVGDTVILMRRAQEGGIGGPQRGFGPAIQDEIERKLREYGYWIFVEVYEEEPPPTLQELFDVPIEVLNLSVRTYNSLKRTGITSVGDCVVILSRGPDAMISIRNFGEFALDELIQQLKANGYWLSVHNNRYLFDLPFEQLGLSHKAISALKSVDINNVGDCLRFFIQTRHDYPSDRELYRDKLPFFIETKSHVPFFVFMFLEVEPLLKERGYWAYVEDEAEWPTLTPRTSYDIYNHPPLPYRHLFEIPVEYLGLSTRARDTVMRLGLSNVGDCVNFYRPPVHTAFSPRAGEVMLGEVLEKMKAHGFWSYVEAAS